MEYDSHLFIVFLSSVPASSNIIIRKLSLPYDISIRAALQPKGTEGEKQKTNCGVVMKGETKRKGGKEVGSQR